MLIPLFKKCNKSKQMTAEVSNCGSIQGFNIKRLL